jgi:hypothetical protein
MLRLRRPTIAARFAALVTALLVVAWPRVAATQARPSVAQLLIGYIAWLRNPGVTRPLFEFDLDAARTELARLRPRLTPLRPITRCATGAGVDVPAAGSAVSTSADTALMTPGAVTSTAKACALRRPARTRARASSHRWTRRH